MILNRCGPEVDGPGYFDVGPGVGGLISFDPGLVGGTVQEF